MALCDTKCMTSNTLNPLSRIERGKKSMAGFREFMRVGGTAISALMVCCPMMLEARPRTPLRVFCIAAFEYLARLPGGTLGRKTRLALAHACDFGSLCDEYYDEQKLDLTEYRSLRCTLRRTAPEAATASYIQQLRKAERGRPVLTTGTLGVAEATIDYRKSVIELSLRWLQGIAGSGEESVQFHSIVSLVCLMQLADDLLDWKDDLAERSPTYVTAFLLERRSTGVATRLRAEADTLLQHTVRAARQNAAAVPFAVAGVATWTFVVTLIKVRFAK